MPRAGAQHVGTKTIDHHNDRVVDRAKAKSVVLTGYGIEATSQHIGKAQSVGFGRR